MLRFGSLAKAECGIVFHKTLAVLTTELSTRWSCGGRMNVPPLRKCRCHLVRCRRASSRLSAQLLHLKPSVEQHIVLNHSCEIAKIKV